MPRNSEFDYQFLLPWKYLDHKKGIDGHWENNSIATFVLLQKGSDNESFSKKIENLRKNQTKNDSGTVTYLFPFTREYLDGNFEDGVEKGGYISSIRLFGLIGLIVLIIACINFMNLSTARSEKRAKEEGSRYSKGHRRKEKWIGTSIYRRFHNNGFFKCDIGLCPNFNGPSEV
ncbi:MAG: hypothetical protein RIM83_01495 [Allomuricauda sp.]